MATDIPARCNGELTKWLHGDVYHVPRLHMKYASDVSPFAGPEPHQRAWQLPKDSNTRADHWVIQRRAGPQKFVNKVKPLRQPWENHETGTCLEIHSTTQRQLNDLDARSSTAIQDKLKQYVARLPSRFWKVIGHLNLPLLKHLMKTIGHEDRDYIPQVPLDAWAAAPQVRNLAMFRSVRTSHDGVDELA